MPYAKDLAGHLHDAAFESIPVLVGGAQLSHPLMLAAGLVKGDGFADETAALHTFADPRRKHNSGLANNSCFGRAGGIWILHPPPPSWQRWNSCLATFLFALDAKSRRTEEPWRPCRGPVSGTAKDQLPREYGINIAVSPAVNDAEQQTREVIESLEFFLDAGLRPSWFTLNLSCPNTDDDPLGYQLDAETRRLCGAFIRCLDSRELDIPALGEAQSHARSDTISFADSHLS